GRCRPGRPAPCWRCGRRRRGPAGSRGPWRRAERRAAGSPVRDALLQVATASGEDTESSAGEVALDRQHLHPPSMRIGVPREVKNHEYRVALTPAGAQELTRAGHHVLVERGAGVGSSIGDEDFEAAGARIVPTADDVWGAADLVLKVKEPIEEEYHRLRRDQVLFTYLHLAASRECTQALLAAGTTAIAYETVRLPDGSLPLLAPMSEVAGRLAPQAGANALLKAAGGRGVLLGGVPGVRPADVVVIGAGVAGQNAVAMAVGLGAEVTVLDVDIAKLRRIDERYAGRVRTLASTNHELERACLEADLVIGAVLVPGARAPRLVSNDLVRRMKPGSVLVDVAIDQGGCFAD